MWHINYTQTAVQHSSHNPEPLGSELNAQWEVWLQMTGIYIRKAIKCHPLNLILGIYLTERWLHLIIGHKMVNSTCRQNYRRSSIWMLTKQISYSSHIVHSSHSGKIRIQCSCVSFLCRVLDSLQLNHEGSSAQYCHWIWNTSQTRQLKCGWMKSVVKSAQVSIWYISNSE